MLIGQYNFLHAEFPRKPHMSTDLLKLKPLSDQGTETPLQKLDTIRRHSPKQRLQLLEVTSCNEEGSSGEYHLEENTAESPDRAVEGKILSGQEELGREISWVREFGEVRFTCFQG